MTSGKVLAAVAIAALVLGCSRPPGGRKAPKAELGTPAPDFTLKTHTGEQFTLSALKGKSGAVLVFFASWCPGCMTEVPHLVEFQKAHGDKEAPVFGVNVQETDGVVARLVQSKGINYKVLMDTQGDVRKRYGVYGIPLIVGVGKDGLVKYRDHELPADEEALVKALTETKQEEGT